MNSWEISWEDFKKGIRRAKTGKHLCPLCGYRIGQEGNESHFELVIPAGNSDHFCCITCAVEFLKTLGKIIT